MAQSETERLRINSTIDELCERFPKAFSRKNERIKPLKPDIIIDITQVFHLQPDETDRFRQALHAYCHWTSYLIVVAYGRRYHNLWGDHAGRVTDDERIKARAELIRRGMWNAYHKRKFNERPLLDNGEISTAE